MKLMPLPHEHAKIWVTFWWGIYMRLDPLCTCPNLPCWQVDQVLANPNHVWIHWQCFDFFLFFLDLLDSTVSRYWEVQNWKKFASYFSWNLVCSVLFVCFNGRMGCFRACSVIQWSQFNVLSTMGSLCDSGQTVLSLWVSVFPSAKWGWMIVLRGCEEKQYVKLGWEGVLASLVFWLLLVASIGLFGHGCLERAT